MTLADIWTFLNTQNSAFNTVGLFGGLAVFYWKTREEQQDRKRKLYDEIDAAYIDVHKLLLEHPDVDASWFVDQPDKPLSDDQLYRQYLVYEIIVRLFERIFLTFQHASSSQRAAQWNGWDCWIEDYCKKRSFQDWWLRDDAPLRAAAEGDTYQFDKGFESYIFEKMRKHARNSRFAANLKT